MFMAIMAMVFFAFVLIIEYLSNRRPTKIVDPDPTAAPQVE